MPRNILNRFKDLLGEYCAVNQFVELSQRVFINEHSESLSDPEQFHQIASHNQLTLTSYNITKVSHRVSLNYIISTHLCFSVFLDELREQVNRYGIKNNDREKNKSESWLQYIADMILTPEDSYSNKMLIEICEYYRLVRNRATHDIDGTNELLKKHSELSRYSFDKETKYSKLSAPNLYDAVNFDDFVMFARSVQQLSRIMFFSLRYDYMKIIPIMMKYVAFKCLNNRDKTKKQIYTYMITYFHDDGSLVEKLDGIYDELMARWSNG